MYTRIDACRSCQGRLEPAFSLGNQYVVDFVKQRSNNLQAPLELVFCPECKLLQLRHSVNQDRLFRKFWYRSGINESMRDALRDVVNSAATLANLEPKDNVLDIGSNDGTLLSLYGSQYRTVGVDPCKELVEEAIQNQRQDVGISGYFKRDTVKKFGPYKVITAIAMFYDLEDPVQFLNDCKAVLHQDGVLIVQMNYLKLMLENMAFDNISHEHLAYYSLMSMQHLVRRCNLDIAGCELNQVNGGSIRLYIVHSGSALTGYRSSTNTRVRLSLEVDRLMREEIDMKLDTLEPYKRFQSNMNLIGEVLRDRLALLKSQGKEIYAYGASTRGTTLLQCLQLPEGTLSGAVERDPRKYGLMMVGSWLPIISEKEAREKGKAFLLLPYHFWEGIRRREATWIEEGGEFIVPLPVPFSHTSQGTYNLITGRNSEAMAEVAQ